MKTKSFREARYYCLDIRAELPEMDAKTATDPFLADLKRAVSYQLRSDVKVGVCLSGGLDSSSLAGLSAITYNAAAMGRMQAIHAKSSEKESTRAVSPCELAERSDIELTVIEPTAEEFIEAIDEAVYLQEEPFATPSIFMQYFLFQKPSGSAAR